MQRLLRQITTGRIFAWSRHLADRDDMEPYAPEQVEQPAPVELPKPVPVLRLVPQPPPPKKEVERPAKNTSENPVKAKADGPDLRLKFAMEAFRRQVNGNRKAAKSRRKA